MRAPSAPARRDALAVPLPSLCKLRARLPGARSHLALRARAPPPAQDCMAMVRAPRAPGVTEVVDCRLGLHGQLDEMLHEHLQRDVVGDDHGRVGAAAGAETLAGGVVRRRGVHLGGQEPCLGAARVGLDVSGDGEPVGKDLLRVLGWCLEQHLEVGVLLLLLVARVVPGLYHLPAPDHNVEERVQQQDDIRLERGSVQQHRLRRALIEGVLQQGRLDHHKRVHGVLPEDDHAVVCSLVGARIEGLKEVAASEVVHELREDGELRA
mmetsp:Transcript_65222/g.173901  ORF Transcript_65222/g.173901 Transcript_65222/m.173901 type:complete len:266 (-) Transcript_65222:1751-2548(-)